MRVKVMHAGTFLSQCFRSKTYYFTNVGYKLIHVTIMWMPTSSQLYIIHLINGEMPFLSHVDCLVSVCHYTCVQVFLSAQLDYGRCMWLEIVCRFKSKSIPDIGYVFFIFRSRSFFKVIIKEIRISSFPERIIKCCTSLIYRKLSLTLLWQDMPGRWWLGNVL